MIGVRSVEPCWDEELSSALGRGFQQEGSLDFEKAWWVVSGVGGGAIRGHTVCMESVSDES